MITVVNKKFQRKVASQIPKVFEQRMGFRWFEKPINFKV